MGVSDEERAKGFVRPVRTTYRHVLCGGQTSVPLPIAEIFARDVSAYNGTFCCYCGQQFRLTDSEGDPAFLWVPDGSPVGT